MRLVFFGVMVSLAGSLPAVSQEILVSGQAPATLHHQLLTLAIREAAPAATQAAAKPPGFNEWTAKLETAKARRSSGRKLFWAGTIAATVLPIVGVAAGSTGSTAGGSSYVWLTLSGLLGGGGLATYGGYKWYRSAEDIQDIDREGRTKGYLSQNGTPGLRLAVTFRF